MLRTMNEEELGAEHRSYKVAFLSDSSLKLYRSVYRRVDLASDARFHIVQQPGDLREPDGADDHEIHIAIAASFVGGDRSINKCHFDFSQSGRESLSEDLHDPNCLNKYLLQFPEDRAPSICLVIDSISVFPPLKQSRFGKCGQVPLYRGRAQVKVPCKLTEIPPLIGLKNGGGQNSLFCRREQRF